MQSYLISLFAASLAVALIGVLAPRASAGQLKFISSLFLICVLAAPLPRFLGELDTRLPEVLLPPSEGEGDAYTEQLEEAMNSASKTYFANALTELLEERFSIPSGELRCAIVWREEEERLAPEKVTLLLSGSAIWKNPAEMEALVRELLGCECNSAIE